MLEADLYLDKVDYCRYCSRRAKKPCPDFIDVLKAGKTRIQECNPPASRKYDTFKLVLEAKRFLPSIPQLTVPQPVEHGLFPLIVGAQTI